VLMLALGEQFGGNIWGKLDDDELREISIVMSTLGTIEASSVENLMLEFGHAVLAGPECSVFILRRFRCHFAPSQSHASWPLADAPRFRWSRLPLRSHGRGRGPAGNA